MDQLIYNLITNWHYSIGATITTALLVASYYYLNNVYSYWERLGIKGPKPLFLFGNALDIITKNARLLDNEYIQKYGKVYGVYFGLSPRLVIADPEVLIQISVKDFEYATDHDIKSEFLGTYASNFIFNISGHRWKRTRVLLSPTFTSLRIRRMFNLLKTCAADLVLVAKEKMVDGVVNVKDIFNLYTIDGISTCCYGLKLERSGDSLVKGSREDFVEVSNIFKPEPLKFLIFFSAPKFLLRLTNFSILSDSKLEPLVKRLRHIINRRKEMPNKPDDYLQLLLDAKPVEKLDLDDLDSKENHHAALTSETLQDDHKRMIDSKAELNELEIVSSAALLMAVGQETTSNLLSVCLYCLSHHQEIQDILYKELCAISREKNFDYDAITSCQYLDAVISESLRYLNPVLNIERQFNKDYYLEKYKILLPKNSKVNLALNAIMNDSDLWPEPEKFKPERFLPENKHKIVPGSYCPFGLGPRHCLGMRFALTEAKLGVSNLIMSYQILPAPNTTFPPEIPKGFVFMPIKTPLIKIKPRQT